MNEKDFVHLHLHTDYSLLDGAIRIKPLAKRAEETGARAVAITDHGNMFGAISFYNTMKGSGIKPIIGIEAYLTKGRMTDRGETTTGERGRNHLILLAKDFKGYQNLIKLTSFSYTEGFYYKPCIDKEFLAEHSEGLIGLSACLSGVPSALLLTDKFDEAARRAKEFEDIFGKGNYYLEVQNHQLEEEVGTVIPGMLELSKKTGIPLVATNDCHYLMLEDWKAHDIHVCIGAGKVHTETRRVRYKEAQFYFRTPQEMQMLFADLPDAILNTVRIAEMCNLELPFGQNHLPEYRVPEGFTTDSYFAKVARDGLAERWETIQNRQDRKHDYSEYQARLEREIATIIQMGFPGYFLIVWDFINYAKKNSIPVGPGRGSAAGSCVAYSMKITDIDPLQYDLLFERFLNPERVSMPDIDIDFCIHGRQKVIDYVADYYGRDRVSMIATFGTMASKAAIKDVGRALDMPYAEVDKIAKMIPPPVRGRNVSIEQAVKEVPELRKAIETDERVKNVIEIAKRLEGCSRHTSVHAAGVVISPRPLYELVPVSKTSRDEITTQYSMTDLEKTGMLKMDFLALTTLTIIEDCLKSIERETGARLDLANIPLDDKPSLQIFADGKTEAIFQFEGCLSGDTQVGKNRTIKDVYREIVALKSQGKFALDGRTGILRLKSCYVDEGKFHNNTVQDVIFTGLKPVYRIVTEGNYTIKATADHHFLTERGWVTLGEIDPEKDKILFRTDSYYGRRVCVDCGAPLKVMVLSVLRCKACSARMTANPSKPGARKKIALANKGKRPWNYAIDHTSKDYKKWHTAIVQAYDKYRGKTLEEIVGAAAAAQRKAKVSARFRGTGNPMYGRSHQGRTAYSAAGLRADLGHYVRSAWEADFARVLNYLGVGYEYEPRRFTLRREDGTSLTYAPDFYIPSEKCWYEIKGWMDNKSAEKIQLFKVQYPQEPLIVIDKTRFAELQMQYRDLVEWECPKVPQNTAFLGIRQITYEGEEETYDIKMRAPGNNFLANGFVVHNSGMQDLCRRLKPEGLEDLSALNALYRPGPIDSGMVDDFIDRRHGKKKVRYDFGELKDVLGNTLGITVYQEQIMAIFQRLAGYSLGEADLVRRAMGKKKREELDKHKEKFTRQAVERGHDKDKLDKLWASMEGFADYAFNRSHSFAYGQLAYQTAYLKAHYPTHFWAAVMSNELNNTAKVVKYLQEARLQGIQILPPDINESIDTFTARGKTIRFGLAAIKGIGQTAVASMIEARKEGAFKSIFDFAERVDSKAVNKRVMEGLVKSGAFDSINTGHRAQLFAAIDSAIDSGQRAQKSKASGQVSLFGAMLTEMSAPEPPLPSVEMWSQSEQLKGEKETLGFYLSGHPLQGYEAAIKDIANADVDKLPNFNNGAIVSVGGIIMELAIKTTKKGDRFALCQLEDQYGSVRIVAWPESYKKHASILQNDAPVLVRGRLEIDDGGAMTIYPEDIQSLINIRERAAKLMVMRFPVDAAQDDKLDKLYHLLDSHRGDCEIVFEVELEDGNLALIQPNQFVRVKVTPELTHSITEVMGKACRVELRVGKATGAARQSSAAF